MFHTAQQFVAHPNPTKLGVGRIALTKKAKKKKAKDYAKHYAQKCKKLKAKGAAQHRITAACKRAAEWEKKHKERSKKAGKAAKHSLIKQVHKVNASISDVARRKKIAAAMKAKTLLMLKKANIPTAEVDALPYTGVLSALSAADQAVVDQAITAIDSEVAAATVTPAEEAVEVAEVTTDPVAAEVEVEIEAADAVGDDEGGHGRKKKLVLAVGAAAALGAVIWYFRRR
jgi:hypothetical protein